MARRFNFGLDVISSPADSVPSPVEADIIFVHGLNGHARDTWTTRVDGHDVFWLENYSFLRKDIPAARIFTFGYNAKLVGFNSNADLDDIAHNLIDEIQLQRSTELEKNRRIIFVCHSLGGLLVKKALLLSSLPPSHQRVQNCTSAILFIATPHGGSAFASILKRVARLSDSPLSYAKLLKPRSRPLIELTTKFRQYYTDRNDEKFKGVPLAIASFTELSRTPVFPFSRWPAFQVVTRECGQSGLRGERQRPCQKDHRSIARFHSPLDPDYVALRETLLEWMSLEPPSQFDLELVPTTTLDPPPTDRDPYRFKVEMPKEVIGGTEAPKEFIGRIEDLKTLEKYLPVPVTYRTVTIWGEGTIGKTSLGLQFASIHGERYRTVALLEASTEIQLRASFDSFLSFLSERSDGHLSTVTNALPATRQASWEKVKEWFETEVDWLLILDNIRLDEKYCTPIEQYVPRKGRGHLVLISRSPRIAHYANPKREVQVKVLNDQDAVQMLSQAAGFHTPQDSQDLQRLIKRLRGIPGGICQAGRYLHDRRTPLSDYVQILGDQQENMRRESTDNEQGSAFATWYITFNRLQEDFPRTMRLLHFLVMLQGSDIPKELFDRAAIPVFKWDTSGCNVPTTLGERQIPDSELLQMLTDHATFNAALQPLIDCGLITREQDASKNPYIQIHPDVQWLVRRKMTAEERLSSWKCAIRVVYHAFPEDDILELKFSSLRTKLTAQVFHCAEDAQANFTADELKDVAPALVNMLLSALARSGNENLLLPYAEKLVRAVDDGYYRCLAARWRGYMHEAQGHRDYMHQVLAVAQAEEEQRYKSRNGCPENPRSHAALGDIIMHRAQFLTREKKYELCDQTLNSWSPTTVSDISPMECKTVSDLKTARARNLFAQGFKGEATKLLEEIAYPIPEESETPDDEDVGSITRLNKRSFNWATVTLCEVYCSEGSDKFDEVLKMVNPRIGTLLRSDARHEFLIIDYQRLRCEVMLRSGRYHDFKRYVEQLINDLDDPRQHASNLRQVEQMATAKSLLARYYHIRGDWQNATTAWLSTLKCLGVEYDITESADIPSKYSSCITVLSLAVCYAHTGGDKAKTLFEALEDHTETLKHPRHDPNYTRWFNDHLYKDEKIPPKFKKKVLDKVAAAN